MRGHIFFITVICFSSVFLAACLKPAAKKKTVTPAAPIEEIELVETTVVEQLVESLSRTPLNYDDLSNWACTSALSNDLCHAQENWASIAPTLNVTALAKAPSNDGKVDCFYVYPTVDMNPIPKNHDTVEMKTMPRIVIQAQAAKFSEVCRVFAPFYRQATMGAYMALPSSAKVYYQNAFVDVAAAFDHYLKHWNNGRPVVIIGHSQGAQMATYLLHKFFDGDNYVSAAQDGLRSTQLREKLLLALPLGFNVFTPKSQTKGGSFSDVPLCTGASDTGCVIAYRTHAESMAFHFRWWFPEEIDRQLVGEGYIHKGFESGKDELACVNPALGSRQSGYTVSDVWGATLLWGLTETKVLTGTGLPYSYSTTTSTYAAGRDYLEMPNRYTGTCRKDIWADRYLAVGFNNPPLPSIDWRGDPLAIKTQATSPLSVHLVDFNLALGDLVGQVRNRANAYHAKP
jgi:pimeloyl-ACP methyl ester carboxylesterase